MPLGQLPPGQLPPRTTATWTIATQDNCHHRDVVGREHLPTHFYVFLCSPMKVNTLLKTDSKICLKCYWKSLVSYVRFHTSILAPHLVPPGQQPPRILRFTHHIQAIKFSLVYRVAARKGLLAAERFRTSGCYDNITSTYFRKSELKRICRCHVTHKSKAKVK